MELTGIITHVLPLQSGEGKTGNTWKKQDYVIETQDQYPKKVCFNLWGDKVDQFKIQTGEVLTVQFDIESREYNERWYTDVKAWKVDRVAAGSQSTPPQNYGGSGIPLPTETPTPFEGANKTDDLPF